MPELNEGAGRCVMEVGDLYSCRGEGRRPDALPSGLPAAQGVAQACEQRKIEERKLAFLKLKLEVLKAENERLKRRDGGEQPSPGTRDYEAILKASRETATEVIRRRLSRTAQAGLPSLGKRR